MAHHFLTLLLLLTVAYHLQISDTFKLDSSVENDLDQADDPPFIPRQEGDDYEEEDRKQVVSGIGNILTGAFSLNLNKILKGAFSFADEDVQNNILNKLFFRIPSTTLRTVSNKTKVIDPNNTAATRRRRSTTTTATEIKPTNLPISSSAAEPEEEEEEDSS